MNKMKPEGREYIEALEAEFERNANPELAQEQRAYLRNRFVHYGLKTPIRREIQKPFLLKSYLPEKQVMLEIARTLWDRPEREFHYFAQELIFKYHRQFEPADMEHFEYMITHQSWWDTVDFIATKPVGTFFKMYPDLIQTYTDKWLKSGNMWLQRTALLFQLKNKDKTDAQLLGRCIEYLIPSEEFFINKAIGWTLREYSKTNPDWVLDFVENHALSVLSKKEALRLIFNT